MNPSLKSLLVFVFLAAAGFAETANLAVKWYRLAADLGFADAQQRLGDMYRVGRGVPKDYVEAVKWYRKSADQWFADAQYQLGIAYANGAGVPKDLVQAHAWLNIAGANWLEDAKKSLEIAEKEMTSEQKAEAMKLARELFAKLPTGSRDRPTQ